MPPIRTFMDFVLVASEAVESFFDSFGALPQQVKINPRVQAELQLPDNTRYGHLPVVTDSSVPEDSVRAE